MTDAAITTRPADLVNVNTGEVLERTPENAAVVIAAAREMKGRVQDVIRDATEVLVDEARRQGKKTLELIYVHGFEHRLKVVVSGGETTEYDASALLELLADAGCPQERIDEAVVAEVTYKVNRSVLRQLAGANPDYRAAIELAERKVEKPWTARVPS